MRTAWNSDLVRRNRLGSTFSDLNGDSFPSLPAAETKYFPAADGRTSLAEAVNAGAMDSGGLPGALGHMYLRNNE